MDQLKNRFIITFIICLGFTQFNWAQTYAEEESSETVTLNNTEVTSDFFNSYFNPSTNSVPIVQGSSLFLSQVGENNTARVAVSAESSNINIAQNGNENDVNLKYQVNTVYTDLNQNGNNNYILDYSIDQNEDISLDLQQNGSDLTFERFGTNQITKNIKFTQTSASPTIIIRSFK